MANLRPFQIILLAIFGFLALLGLTLFATFRGDNSAQKTGAVVVWGTLPAAQVTPSLNQMKELHKQFSKVSYVERDEATIGRELSDAIATGAGPDLVIISQESLVAERGKVNLIPSSSLSERTYRDTYLPIYELYLTEGGSYGIPLVVDPLVLYYNKTLIANAGAVRPPATWEAVTGLAPYLTVVNDAQTISRSTIAFGTYGNVDHARAILSLLFFQAGQSITAESGQGLRATLARSSTDATGGSATESALNFYTEFANPNKTIYSWNRSLSSSRQAFTVGDVALYPGYASEVKRLAAANPNLNFDMAPVPQPGTAAVRVTYAKAYAMVIPKAARNASGAYQTAMAFTAADTLPSLARALGMAPAVRAYLTPSNKDLYESVYYPEALIARGWLSPAPTATDSIFASMIDNVNSGRMSVNQAIVTADQALSAALF